MPAQSHATARRYPTTARSAGWWWLDEHVENPSVAALLDASGQVTSRRALGARVRALAAHLETLGVGRHERLALIMPPGTGQATCLLATMAVAVAAPLSSRSPAGALQRDFARLKITRVVVPEEAPEAALHAADALGLPIVRLNPDVHANQPNVTGAGPAPEHCALLLQSSGTTATPKIIPLTHANLWASAQAIREVLMLQPEDRTIAAMPLFHVHGIVATLLAPLLSGGSVVCAGDPDPRALANHVSRLRPTWLSLSPTLLRGLVTEIEAQGGADPSHDLRVIRAVTQPLPQDLLARLETLFGVPVLEVYGMTEAASQICSPRLSRNGPPRSPGCVGPAAGPEVTILGPDGVHQPPGVRGEVAIRGPGVTRGYDDTEGGGWIQDAHGAAWFPTGDEGYLDLHGSLHLTGRLKEMINRGGMKLAPARVDEALQAHPAVLDATAFAIPHASLGEDLVAAAVLCSERGVSEAELRTHLMTTLLPHEVPSRIVFVDSLPRNAGGKLQRGDMPALFAEHLHATPLAPQDEMAHHVAALFAEIIGGPPLDGDANFFLLGGDSLSAQRVVHRLEQYLGIDLEPTLLFLHPGVSDLATHLDDRLNAALAAGSAGVAHPPQRARDLQARVDYLRAIGGRSPDLEIFPAENASDEVTGGGMQPASFAQSRLWMLHQIEPTLTAYHIVIQWRLHGPLDVPAMKRALDALLVRHSTLRTSFHFEGEVLQQHVHARCDFPLVEESVAPDELSLRLQQRHLEEHDTLFDLTLAPLIRGRLLAITPLDHVLMITVHHIVSDGWSSTILARDIAGLYRAERANTAPTLPPVPVGYAHYAQWQRHRLKGPRLERLKEFWREGLAQLPPLVLPTRQARPSVPTYQGAEISFTFEPRAVSCLERLCRAENATLQMGFLAVLADLLQRYSRQDDFAIGVPVWGRNHPTLEPLIGFFVNTLPIRVHTAGTSTFRDLLRHLREASLAAYAHQEYPFEQMVEVSGGIRDTSRNPLVQVMLQLATLPLPELGELDGVDTARHAAPHLRSRFDLEFFLRRDIEGGITCRMVYATDLFLDAHMAELAEHFSNLVTALSTQADHPRARISVLSATTQDRIAGWEHGINRAVSSKPVHARFAEQAARTPHREALCLNDECLSYADLDQRVQHLAQQLMMRGVGLESRVAVCLHRSMALIVSVLAILRAGGTYMPLDPAWPVSRISRILGNASPALLLSVQPPAALGLATTLPWIDPSHPHPEMSVIKGDDFPQVSPHTLAYILHTSGSTGEPKAVALEHRVLNNLLEWHQTEPRLGDAARTLQFASCVFDVSLQEIFSTLCTGGTLVLVHEEDRRDFDALREVLARQRVERVFMPLVALEQLALAVQRARSPNPLVLRDIVSAGEKLSLSPPLRGLLQRLPKAWLHNHYGPTESHVVTAWSAAAEALQGLEEVPIGRPIFNTRIRILDPGGLPCPPGVPGELYISGDGLAREYLGDAALTDARFKRIPGPGRDNGPDVPVRSYATGDLASWREDGQLRFHGRLDGQLKVRGHRLEPGDVEANLLAHPAVAQAVVVLRNLGGNLEPVLVAYWVAQGEVLPAQSELREFMTGRVAGWMVPVVFIRLPAMPMTRNGKLDHAALPAPETRHARSADVTTQSALESTLYPIWVEVLGHADFEVTDDFFLIGGHSLLTLHLKQRVDEALGREVPMHLFFAASTLRNFARAIEEQTSHRPERAMSDATQSGARGILAEPPAITALIAQQIELTQRWPGKLHPGHRFIRTLGAENTRGTLFWCFQGAQEFADLAALLCPEITLHGMRSAHAIEGGGAIYRNPALLARMAELYAAEMLALHPREESFVLGGNCQAGWVANAIAHQLVAHGRSVKTLVLMEPRMQEINKGRLAWSGSTTLLWGDESALNPFAPRYAPRGTLAKVLQRVSRKSYARHVHRKLAVAFDGTYRILTVPGLHGAFFKAGNLPALASRLKQIVSA